MRSAHWRHHGGSVPVGVKGSRPNPGRRRRGDVFFLQEFVAMGILLFIGVLIFGLFYVTAKVFEDRIAKRQHVDEAFSSTNGGEALRAYLATRMDEPAGKFLPRGVDSVQAGSHQLTFMDAIGAIAEDEACLEALSDHGMSYTKIQDPANPNEFTTAFTERNAVGIPEGLCRDFYLRTLLFMRALAPRDGFLLTITVDSESLSIGKTQPMSGGPVTVATPGAVPVITPSNMIDAASGEQPLYSRPAVAAKLFIAGGAR